MISNLPVVKNSLESYLVQINRFALLTPEEEFKLAVRYRKHNDIEAAQKLITANLRFVVKVTFEYKSYGVKLLDLIQEGNIGLRMAVKKFNPYKGYRFISYAIWWIRAYIQNFIIKTWSLVKIGTTQAQKKLFYKIGKIRKALESNGEDEEKKIREHEVQNAMKRLNEKEVYVIKNRIMADEPLTLQQIGDHLKLSRERVRQIESEALKKLKKEFSTRSEFQA